MRRVLWIACAAGLAALLFGTAGQGGAAPLGDFSPPLGQTDGAKYGPRQLEADGTLIEDTGYDVKNPDLPGSTCFGVSWREVYHAGQDLYREDGKSTAGAAVTTVADGEVVYANPDLNYPGLVVIIRHEPLDGGEHPLYSVYAHLDDNSLEVAEGQRVQRGELLGKVMYQAYAGRFPEHHPDDDDSHLHFELRRFFDARSIYKEHPACNGLTAGRGYTYPGRPGGFPNAQQGYVDPAELLGS